VNDELDERKEEELVDNVGELEMDVELDAALDESDVDDELIDEVLVVEVVDEEGLDAR